MGGAKKKGLAQMQKSQQVKEKPKTKGKGQIEKKKISAIGLPSFEDKNVQSELTRMKAVTQSSVASQFGLRVSAAKEFISELTHRGVLDLVEGCSRIKIYRVISTSTS
ncbi:MAG: hypothetical protein ACE5KO_04065 [Candidatus Bathyarchaeia archaeon]